MEILILDDERTTTAVHGAYVRKVANCEAVCFSNPTEALDWAATHDPALVIVDYFMPAMDGIEFIRRFRRLPGKSSTPALMVTAFDDENVRELALGVGVSDFLVKPVDRSTLTACVVNLSAARSKHGDAAVCVPERQDLNAMDPGALATILEERERLREPRELAASADDLARDIPASMEDGTSEEILIVDDERTSTALFACYVRRFKCLPKRFAHASEALAWCETHEPAAVIVDYMMPDMDGLEFTRRFRLLAGKAGIPVLMVSAYGDSLLKEAARAAGVNEFLHKPVHAADLTMHLRTMFAERALRNKLAKDERLVAEKNRFSLR